MAARKPVKVVIHGRTYHLSGKDPEHTRRMARKVDETLSHFSAQMPGVEPYQIAILAALHLADELSAVRDDFRAYQAQAAAWADRMLQEIDRDLADKPRVQLEEPSGTAEGSTE